MAGGNPDTLTLRRFVDVAYAILVEEYQRLGVDLLSALEKVSALGGGAEAETDRTAEQNAAAMQQLQQMMAGVKGAPVT